MEYELTKLKQERISLLNNWNKKKEESLARILILRAELSEIDAVKAAREESYAAFGALADSILNLTEARNLLLSMKPDDSESQMLESTTTPWQIINQINNSTQAAAAAESRRMTSHRGEHQTRCTYIQRKSKDIYNSLSEEKKSVDQYATQLQARMAGLEEALTFNR